MVPDMADRTQYAITSASTKDALIAAVILLRSNISRIGKIRFGTLNQHAILKLQGFLQLEIDISTYTAALEASTYPGGATVTYTTAVDALTAERNSLYTGAARKYYGNELIVQQEVVNLMYDMKKSMVHSEYVKRFAFLSGRELQYAAEHPDDASEPAEETPAAELRPCARSWSFRY